MIQLDLRTDLAAVRAAYDARQLQAQTRPGTPCAYSGPCAVGVMVTPEERIQLDGDAAPVIGTLLHGGHIIVPDDQRRDFVRLQQTHDMWSTARAYAFNDEPVERATRRLHDEFVAVLTELEAKYGA